VSIKLSVIIPCFNQEKFILKTLDSVRTQVFKNWECIIVDDGSTDGSQAIIQHFIKADIRFKYFYQKNSGVSSARNLGIVKAQGEYIHFLDGDDVVRNYMYDKFISFLDNNRDIDVIYGHYDLIDETDKQISVETVYPSLKSNHARYLMIKNIFPPLAAIVRKNKSKTGFCFDVKMDYCEDWDFWLSLSLHGYKFYCIDIIVGSYRKHSDSTSTSYLKMLKGAEKVLIKNNDVIKKVKLSGYTLTNSLNALYLSAYYQAINNYDVKSINYLENKVQAVSFVQFLSLCLSSTTLPQVLNYAESQKPRFIYCLFYIPIIGRHVARAVIKRWVKP
jgi:glycosyltransferase involved in cell wall biosynthesis